MRILPLIAAALASLPALPANAEPTSNTASTTLSRHHTSNALDNPLALADGFTRLRGSFDWGVEHAVGQTRLALATDITRHDTYSLEDDARLSMSASTTVPVADWLELRGTLSAAISEEGDEFAIANGFLASKTRLAILSAALQAGIRLDPQTSLVLEMAATTEEAGRTRFPDTDLPSLNLEADRKRLALSATAMRTEGILSYGAHAGLHMVRAEAASLLPEIALVQYTLKLQAALASETGHRIGMAAGVQMLDVEQPAFRQLRPTLEIAAALPLGKRVSIVGGAMAGYDTASRDDPVAAFVRKAEAALSISATERLRFVAGVYGERRDNIGLGGRDSVRAAFAEAQWKFTDRLALQIRAETSRKVETLTGTARRAFETQLALTTSL